MVVRLLTEEQKQRYLLRLDHIDQQLQNYQSVAHGVLEGRLVEQRIVGARLALIDAVSQAIMAFQHEAAAANANFRYQSLQPLNHTDEVNELGTKLLEGLLVRFPQLKRLLDAGILSASAILD